MKNYIVCISVLALILNFSCKKSENREIATQKKDSLTKIETLPADSAKSDAAPFSQEIAYKNFKFKVSSPNLEDNNSFTLTISGYSEDNTPKVQQLEKGEKVVKISFDDLDNDDKPEVLVVTHKTKENRDFPYVYSSNSGASMSMVFFNEADKKDYAGNDTFEVAEGKLASNYPLVKDGKPTGKTRQILYRLSNGEAMKQLTKSYESDY